MGDELRTKTGRLLTDEEIDQLVDEAEAGYDVMDLIKRRWVDVAMGPLVDLDGDDNDT